MSRIKSKLEKIENCLNINETIETQIIIMPFSESDFINDGYFKDKSEQDLFLDWRIGIHIKNRNCPPSPMYIFNKQDVEKTIDEYRHYLLNKQKSV